MDITGYIGKKVDVTCTNGKVYSGYVTCVSDAEDSDIGVDSFELGLVDQPLNVEVPVAHVREISLDPRYEDLVY